MELKLNEKYMLTIKEAAAYYGIGMKFLRRCAENEESEYSGVRVPSVRAQETVIPFLKKPPFR